MSNYSIERWKDDVSNGSTMLGFEDWVKNKMDENPILILEMSHSKIDSCTIFNDEKLAQDFFTKACRKLDNDLEDEDVAIALNEGYYEFYLDSVTICHPEIGRYNGFDRQNVSY